MVNHFRKPVRIVKQSWILCRALYPWSSDGRFHREFISKPLHDFDKDLTFMKPDVVLYLTYWYKSNELPTRLAWFWTVLSCCNMYTLPQTDPLNTTNASQFWLSCRSRYPPNARYPWVVRLAMAVFNPLHHDLLVCTFLTNPRFLIEGIITGCIGIASWVAMPASPCQTRGRGRGKGWFNEHEEKIMVNRLLRDDPSKGDMNNRQAVGLRGLIKSFWDFDLWPTYIVSTLFLVKILSLLINHRLDSVPTSLPTRQEPT